MRTQFAAADTNQQQGRPRSASASLCLIGLLAQYADGPVPWEQFLFVFERWCVAQGWEVEYGSVEDESCAIFYLSGLIEDEEESQVLRPGY